jgi:hypothetical protein
MRDAIAAYVRRVKELAEHVRGNEQATKKSLIEPLFAILGYDLTDPRECVPEHREDFGRNRSAKPVDYAFFKDGTPIIFVEAKQVDRKLAGYHEQLGDYFAKAPGAKLGILTNGVHWQFFTDLDNENVMDKRAFVEWHVLGDDPPPWDFLTLLQKSQYNAELIRTFAQRRHQQNLLIEELSRLLEPAPEFIRLAIAKIETRNLKESVIESWKPVLKAAIAEWAKQQRLSSVLSDVAVTAPPEEETQRPRAVETTQAELDAFAAIQRLLGPDRPVEYEDTASYFKVHLPGKAFWAVCRLYNMGERKPNIWARLSVEAVSALTPNLQVTGCGRGWSRIDLRGSEDLELLAPVLCRAWDELKASREEPSEDGDTA